MIRRFAGLMLCPALAVAALAAPAPVYRPKAFEDWISRWEKPVDPVGGRRFDRERVRLTIRPPEGRSRDQALGMGRKTVPHVLREIEGDFDVQVRITGEFEFPEGIAKHGNSCDAGLMLDAGKTGCFSERTIWFNRRWTQHFDVSYRYPEGETVSGGALSPKGATTYHRLSRRGDSVKTAVSLDGKRWHPLYEEEMGVFPRAVKVGVFAWKSGPIPFEAVFDEFELTQLPEVGPADAESPRVPRGRPVLRRVPHSAARPATLPDHSPGVRADRAGDEAGRGLRHPGWAAGRLPEVTAPPRVLHLPRSCGRCMDLRAVGWG